MVENLANTVKTRFDVAGSGFLEVHLQALLVIEHVAAVDARAGQGILHGELMLEDQQGNDVAGIGEVIARVKIPRKVGHVGPEGGIEHQLVAVFAGVNIAAMNRTAMLAGHVPTAPSFRKESAVIDHFAALAKDRFPLFIGKQRARKHRRNTLNKIATMTAKAKTLTGKFRFFFRRKSSWIKRIKDRAELGIYGHDFNQPTRHPADVAIIRVIKSPWMV